VKNSCDFYFFRNGISNLFATQVKPDKNWNAEHADFEEFSRIFSSKIIFVQLLSA